MCGGVHCGGVVFDPTAGDGSGLTRWTIWSCGLLTGDLHKIYLMHDHGVLSRQWTRFSGFHPLPTAQMSQHFRAR
jgi:hypothetical protein